MNDFQQRYIEYMLLDAQKIRSEAAEMPLNSCKVEIKNDKQIVASKGVLCTNDVGLHVSMLTCSR